MTLPELPVLRSVCGNRRMMEGSRSASSRFRHLQGGVVVKRHQYSHHQMQRLLVFSNDSVTKLITRNAWSAASIHSFSYSLGESMVIPLSFLFRGAVACLSRLVRCTAAAPVWVAGSCSRPRQCREPIHAMRFTSTSPRSSRRPSPLDLLYLNGRDLRKLPLIKRRRT